MNSLEKILYQIKSHPSNRWAENAGYEPLYIAHPESKIAIISQAPGIKAQTARKSFDDPSGDNLRSWMNVTKDEFYNPKKFAITAMDFYFPGKGKTGDLPPRKDFAPLWHKKLFAHMPHIKLKILVGGYAQKFYLKENPYHTVTETVKHFRGFIDHGFFPLVHPSPRNVYWMQQNPWFEEKVVPTLRAEVHRILNG